MNNEPIISVNNNKELLPCAVTGVPAELNDPKSYLYSNLVMLVPIGKFIKVSTRWDEGSKRWITTYSWAWLKTLGLSHEWIVGDAVGGDSPWIRKDSNSTFVTDGSVPKAHLDSLEDLFNLYSKSPDLMPPATYMKKPINCLWEKSTVKATDMVADPILKEQHETRKRRMEELRVKYPKQYDPMKEIDDLIKSTGLQAVTFTDKDWKAMAESTTVLKHDYIPQSDNYALGA